MGVEAHQLTIPPDGYKVVHQAVPLEHIEEALRVIVSHQRLAGMTAEQAAGWVEDACWFPDLCAPDHPWHPALTKLRDPFNFEGEVWTQVLLQYPHPPGEPIVPPRFHVDAPPKGGRVYSRIIGVPLTVSDDYHGGIRFQDGTPVLVPGDAVVFGPRTPHSGGVNRSGQIRYAVYFRWVVAASWEAEYQDQADRDVASSARW